MANHLHKQIRDALKTALTGLTTSSTRVFASPVIALADGDLPGLRIFVDSEDATGLTIHQPQMQQRTLLVAVECCAKENTAIEDTLDLMSKEVETVLAAGITLSGGVLEAFYTGMERDREMMEKPVGIKRLRFTVPFTAMSNAPDVLI